MINIIAIVINGNANEVISFTSRDVIEYHLSNSTYGWNDLSEQDQIDFSEDYALWKYARQFGNYRVFRIEVEFQEEAFH